MLPLRPVADAGRPRDERRPGQSGRAALADRALRSRCDQVVLRHGRPGWPRALRAAALDEITRAVFAPYLDTASLLGLAGQAHGAAPQPSDRPLADRQVLTELQAVIGDSTASFERLMPATACERIAGFSATLHAATCQRPDRGWRPAARRVSSRPTWRPRWRRCGTAWTC